MVLSNGPVLSSYVGGRLASPMQGSITGMDISEVGTGASAVGMGCSIGKGVTLISLSITLSLTCRFLRCQCRRHSGMVLGVWTSAICAFTSTAKYSIWRCQRVLCVKSSAPKRACSTALVTRMPHKFPSRRSPQRTVFPLSTNTAENSQPSQAQTVSTVSRRLGNRPPLLAMSESPRHKHESVDTSLVHG